MESLSCVFWSMIFSHLSNPNFYQWFFSQKYRRRLPITPRNLIYMGGGINPAIWLYLQNGMILIKKGNSLLKGICYIGTSENSSILFFLYLPAELNAQNSSSVQPYLNNHGLPPLPHAQAGYAFTLHLLQRQGYYTSFMVPANLI